LSSRQHSDESLSLVPHGVHTAYLGAAFALDVRLSQITRDWSKDAEVVGGRLRHARCGQNILWYL